MRAVAFCIISIAALFMRVSCTSPRPLLRPSAALINQWIELDTATARYQLHDLQHGQVYEVRVSWPATIPASVALWLEASDNTQRFSHTLRGAHRKLLDTGKLLVRGEAAPEERMVCLAARKRSRHRDGPMGGAKHLPYNIVLEAVVWGLPRSVWPVALACILIVLVIVFLVPWWLQHVVPCAVALMVTGGTSLRVRSALD